MNSEWKDRQWGIGRRGLELMGHMSTDLGSVRLSYEQELLGQRIRGRIGPGMQGNVQLADEIQRLTARLLLAVCPGDLSNWEP